jgi:CelD/BcsL family acetyltransferase involved in cellulose biosynthesis
VGSTLLGAEEPELTRRLVQEVGAEVRRRRIRVVEFEQLREDSLLWQALQQLGGEGFRFAPANAFDSHHRIRLAPSAAEFWRGFNSKHRLRMRKEREKFGDYTLRCFRGEGEVDEWLAAAHEVSRKSWQSGQLGLRISNSEEDRRYLTALAKLGAWRSYILFREGTPAAFALSFQWRGVYYYDEIGFDRSLLKLYPGKVMLQEILTDVMTQDVARLFDFGLGDAEYKRAFANEQSRSAKLWMFPLGLRGRWQTASIDGHRKLGRAVRKLVAHMPWYEALRGKLRNAAAK